MLNQERIKELIEQYIPEEGVGIYEEMIASKKELYTNNDVHSLAMVFHYLNFVTNATLIEKIDELTKALTGNKSDNKTTKKVEKEEVAEETEEEETKKATKKK